MFDLVEVLVLFNRSLLRKSAVAACIALSLAPSLAAQDKKKEWKDRSEYDLCESVTKSTDPKDWLATFEKWKQQYPQTDFADVRRQAVSGSLPRAGPAAGGVQRGAGSFEG